MALRFGADASTTLPGYVALICRSAARGDLDTTRILLDNGADPNECDDIGSPLHHASINKLPKLAELLLAVGANPNQDAQFSYGRPLHAAATFYQADIISVLLHRGADVQAVDFRCRTALDIALGLDDARSIVETGRHKAILFLLQGGGRSALANFTSFYCFVERAKREGMEMSTINNLLDAANRNHFNSSKDHIDRDNYLLYSMSTYGWLYSSFPLAGGRR